MRTGKKQVLAWVAGLVALASGTVVHSAPFTNGSFELATPGEPLPALNNYRRLGIGVSEFQDIAGWTITAESVDWSGTLLMAASDGNYCLELNGPDNRPGSLYQTFDVDLGLLHTITFDMAAHPNAAAGETYRDVQVSVGGVTQNFSFQEFVGMSATNMGYVTQTVQFWASASTATLSFTSLDFPSIGPVIDNVRVTVPEPGCAGLLVLGLGAFVLPRRRRQVV